MYMFIFKPKKNQMVKIFSKTEKFKNKLLFPDGFLSEYSLSNSLIILS